MALEAWSFAGNATRELPCLSEIALGTQSVVVTLLVLVLHMKMLIMVIRLQGNVVYKKMTLNRQLTCNPRSPLQLILIYSLSSHNNVDSLLIGVWRYSVPNQQTNKKAKYWYIFKIVRFLVSNVYISFVWLCYQREVSETRHTLFCRYTGLTIFSNFSCKEVFFDH